MSSMRSSNFGKVLGELETEVIQIVWKSIEPVSVGDIVKILSKKRNIAYTTAMTIMGRLFRKGLLTRKPYRKAYLYSPAYTKDVFLTRVSQQIIKNLVSSFGKTAIAHFADEIENMRPSKKRELMKLLKLK